MTLLSTLHDTDGATLRGDVTAGLTTAVMLVPQAMAYAMLAGLDPIVGLYSATVPLIAYAALGTSRQLAVGPVAMVSLLVASAVGGVAEPGTSEFFGYAVLLAAMVGGLQLGMGYARLGFLVNFLSHPVVSGFTSAAALIIGLSQLKHVLGIHIPRSHHITEILSHTMSQVSSWHPLTMAVAAASMAALLLLERLSPRFPRFLLVLAVSTAVSWWADLSAAGLKIVGSVPGGLPTPALPTLDAAAMRALLPMAITISLVGFMESIAVAKGFARKHRYDLDPDQELKALGAANLLGSLFGAYPTTGGFSRSAVNDQAGAKTMLAGLVTALAAGLTLMFLTPLFTFLPKAVLAAIIMTAVVGLVDLGEVRHLWQISKPDLALLVLTFVATLVLGIELGVLTGVLASLTWFVKRVSTPHIAVLGHLPGHDVYRKLQTHPDAQPIPGVLLVRFDAPLFFGNVGFLKRSLATLEADHGTELRAVVLDAKGIGDVDASAVSALEELLEHYQGRGVELWIAGMHGPVREALERAHFMERLGEDRLVFRVHDAVTALTA